MSMMLKSWLGTLGRGPSREGIRFTSEDSARIKNYLLGNEGDDKFYVRSVRRSGDCEAVYGRVYRITGFKNIHEKYQK